MSKIAYAVGHDAEFFFHKGGKVVPAWDSGFGGTKQKPKPYKDSTVGTTYQEDGAAIELGMAPCTISEFYSRSSRCFAEGRVLAKRLGGDLILGSEAEFDSELLASNPEASVMGCEADFNAWERGSKRMLPDVASMGNKRYAAGHLHFSYPNPDAEGRVPRWAIVQFLDVIALNMWQRYNIDSVGDRYKFYGMPGIFRDKPYGIEYRTPHNGWMLGAGTDDHFVRTCWRVVKGCATKTSEEVRALYDSIDWVEARSLLDLSVYPYLDNRINSAAYERILSIGDTLMFNGDME